jgi:hypothetical protein
MRNDEPFAWVPGVRSRPPGVQQYTDTLDGVERGRCECNQSASLRHFALRLICHVDIRSDEPSRCRHGSTSLLAAIWQRHVGGDYRFSAKPDEFPRLFRRRSPWPSVRHPHQSDSFELLLIVLRDDEYLTEYGEIPQPPGEMSILSGFYYITKLFRRQLMSLCAVYFSFFS